MKKILFILCLLSGFVSFGQNFTVGQQYGKDAAGNTVPLGINGTSAITTGTLFANGTWSSGWLPRGQFIGGYTILYSDVAGYYIIEYSDDSVNHTPSMPTITVPYLSSQGTRAGAFSINAGYVRFTYTNSTIAQTKFKFEIRFLTTEAQASMETLNAFGADTRLAQWTKTRIETKTSDGTNDYAPIYRTSNSLNVNVTNFDTSVSVTSLPPITGTVTANFDSTKSRSQFNTYVQNFPSNQSVTVSNPYSVLASDSLKYRKVHSIDNFPAFNLEATQQSVLTAINAINTDQGSPSDAAATNSTSSNGEIALLKGIYNLLNGGGSIAASSTPLTPYFFNYQTTSGVQTIKSTAGIIGSIEVADPGSNDLFIQFFATTGTVTLGTTVPTWVGHIDATLGKIFFNNGSGIYFANGIKYAITTTYNGNGAPSSALGVSMGYK